MKKMHLLSLMLISLMFAGCSYQQYFIIGNATDQTISIKYSLDDAKSDKALFGPNGEVYQSTREYFPNWEHQLPYQDLNNSDDKVWIKLGPKSTLIFGSLSNEKYNEETMSSSAGRSFNLNEMTFNVNGVEYQIDANNFHDFFLEDGGTYKYVIQP
ncbi:MAG: hypothetical protein P8P74_00260 [Crocinitomicaceae bacterium]|nr:hypothetical protein [Crocinitomicaceae bacterium]